MNKSAAMQRSGRPEDPRLGPHGAMLKKHAKERYYSLSAFYGDAAMFSKEKKWNETEHNLKRKFEKAFKGDGPFGLSLQLTYHHLVGLPAEVRTYLHFQASEQAAPSMSPKIGKDDEQIAQPSSVRFLLSSSDIHATQMSIVQQATGGVFATGSRSRNSEYMTAIEERLRSDPHFIYYRVLYGRPRHQALVTHLTNVTNIRDLDHHVEGKPSLCIGVYGQTHEAEWNLVANQHTIMLVIPTTHQMGGYTTALRIDDPAYARRYMQFVDRLYIQSRRFSTRDQVIEFSQKRARK